MLAQGQEGIQKLREYRDALDDLARAFYMPALDAKDFVKRTFDFVNSDVKINDRVECYFFVNRGLLTEATDNVTRRTDDGYAVKGIKTEDRVAKDVQEFWRNTENDRNEYGRMLDGLIKKSRRDHAAINAYIESALDDIVAVPRLSWDKSKLNITNQYCSLGIRGIMGYALIILLNGTLDSDTYLRRCKLKNCNNFFWAESVGRVGKPGRPRKYCTADHKAEYDRLSKRKGNGSKK